jgi:hypothetical protein
MDPVPGTQVRHAQPSNADSSHYISAPLRYALYVVGSLESELTK